MAALVPQGRARAPRPRRPPSPPRASVAVALLCALSAVATSHAFLPRRRAPRRAAASPSSRAGRPRTERRGARAWRDLRGGAAEDVPAAEASTPAPGIAAVEAWTASDPSDANDKQEEGELEKMRYAAIGVLNVPPTRGDNLLMLSYRCHEDPHRQINERWGARETTPARTRVSQGCDAHHRALAQMHGCLCHGLVLTLSRRTDVGASLALDDLLLGVAEGLARRPTGTRRGTFSISYTLEGSREGPVSDESIDKTKKYITEYVERALERVWALRPEKAPLGPPPCRVAVLFSSGSALETATEMALRQRHDGSPSGDGETAPLARQTNTVPRPLFGVLCRQVYDALRHGDEQRGKSSVVWEPVPEDSPDAIKTDSVAGETAEDRSLVVDAGTRERTATRTAPRISTEIWRRVEAVVSRARAEAEERLADMERRMEEALLDGDGEKDGDGGEGRPPLPEFGRDADALVHALSVAFRDVLEEQASMTEPENDWVKAQRRLCLKQVVGTDLQRLFHLHLQSLRDHFGREYELVLEQQSLAEDVDVEGASSAGKAWARRPAARQAEARFTEAAAGAVPHICRSPGGELCEELGALFGCGEAARGLLEDMCEATLTQEMAEEELADVMGESGEDGTEIAARTTGPPSSRTGLRQLVKNVKAKLKTRGPAKWYERWATKALVIGVNYIQGWIVLQALRREAAKRDRAMPKFPLF